MDGHQSRGRRPGIWSRAARDAVRAARDAVRAARDAVPVIQTQSHAPEEASRQMTVYSEGKP